MVIEDWLIVESELKLGRLRAEAARERLASQLAKPRASTRAVLAMTLRAIASRLDQGRQPACELPLPSMR